MRNEDGDLIIKKDGVAYTIATFFHLDYNEVSVRDIDVEPGVDTVAFDFSVADIHGMKKSTTVDVAISANGKEYPGVRTLILGKNVDCVHFATAQFPDAKQVISHSRSYQSGPFLMSAGELEDAFCPGEGDILDLDGISFIGDFALSGMGAAEIINTEGVRHCRCGNEYIGNELRKKYRKKDGAVVIGTIYMAAPGKLKDDTLTIPAGVTCFAKGAFDGARPKKVVIEGADDFGIGAMLECMWDGLEELELKVEGDTEIQFDDIFNELEEGNFQYLKSIRLTGESGKYKAIDGIVYSADGETLWLCTEKKTGRVAIPEGVKRIAKRAFYFGGVDEVEFPESLETIEDYAFMDCPVKSVALPAGVEEVGDLNFPYATYVRAETAVWGLLDATDSTSASDGKRGEKGAGTVIDIGGFQFVRPAFIKNSALEPLERKWQRGEIDKCMAGRLYQDAKGWEDAQDCAVLQYALKPEHSDTKRFVKPNAMHMAERYAKNGWAEMLATLLKMGVLEAEGLQELQKSTAEYGNTAVNAMLLDAIQKTGRKGGIEWL